MINADKCYSEVINICEIIRESEPSNKAIKKIEDDASEAMNQIEKVQWKNVTTNVNESCQCEISPSDPGLLRYEKLISQNSSDFVSWNNKGVYLYENCCFNDSLAAFEKAIKINPDQAEPYYNKGVVLYDTDPKSALECFNESVNIDPSFAEAWFNRYSILMPADINTSDASSMKAYEAAIESYNTAIKLVPEARNFEPPLLVCIKIRS
jgi:tetratricopeptide (TPR) repeat protein